MYFDPDKREHFLVISREQRDILLEYGSLFTDFEVYRHISVALSWPQGYKVLLSFNDMEELEVVAIDIIQQTDDHEQALQMDALVDMIWRVEQKISPSMDFDEVSLDAAVNSKYRRERETGEQPSGFFWQPVAYDLANSSETVFSFKVELGSQLWRIIEIPADATLMHFHETIFRAFDRYDQHLFSFFLPVHEIQLPVISQVIINSAEFTHPSNYKYSPEKDHVYDSATITIAQLGLTINQVWWYLFDFADEWMHRITTVAINQPKDQNKIYPAITQVCGESPSQYPG